MDGCNLLDFGRVRWSLCLGILEVRDILFVERIGGVV